MSARLHPEQAPIFINIDPDLANLNSIDGVTRLVDGIINLQLSQTGYVENGNTDVVELHPDGVVTRFHLNGFLLGLQRLR